ncbi:hypothetical protein AWL63_23280 (plasmid) [Sphingomonas panacis]|uniref:Uncharacterized protein n=1 Tax=Sphingomonas panacis TaxID=1560345 RepID=A0A1B3ZI60_9SPHN|nr:hypothetical protein [Sphingomonas panacis]AOH87104.1 hypothetical protein AWL63_23280 [Sphingomonas panacis]
MSRHNLHPKAEIADVISVTIGWDRPLQTFFAQVFFRTEAEAEEGEPLIWHGTAPGELPTAEAAIAIVAPFADIPTDLAERLTTEMRTTIGVKDSDHQATAKRRIFGSIH